MNKLFVTLGSILVSLVSIPAFSDTSDSIRMARYTEASLAPTREIKNPLDVVINVQLPRQMKLVGEAVEYLLARSGYRIQASRLVNTPEMTVLFALPIPDQHRAMGTLRLESALKVLAGEAYEFHKNQVTREVWYSLKPAFKESLSGVDLKRYKDRWEKRKEVAHSPVIEYKAPQMGLTAMPDVAGSSVTLDEGQYGPVESGETLGSIAKRFRMQGVTITQLMVSMLHKNPDAFIDGNMNRLKQGAVLSLPTEHEIKSYDVTEAHLFEARQYDEYLARSQGYGK